MCLGFNRLRRRHSVRATVGEHPSPNQRIVVNRLIIEMVSAGNHLENIIPMRQRIQCLVHAVVLTDKVAVPFTHLQINANVFQFGDILQGGPASRGHRNR